ncbi:MAG: metallophosphoesterase [candidate division KSB1 bacterium]|nr:metallophosphoesterase [candidate division KSB1 bacterium]
MAERIALDDPEVVRFAVYGDSRPNALHARLLRRIAAHAPNFVLHTGDLVSRGDNRGQWAKFERQMATFRKRFAFLPVMGNHDRGPFFAKVFSLPYADSSGLYFSFRVGNSLFIGLNSEIAADSVLWREQLQWLIRQLSARSARHVFVYLHRPPFSPNPRRAPTHEAVFSQILPILEGFREVRALFCGHDHFYYRTCQGSLTIVTTGGGGARLYAVDPRRLRPGDRWAVTFHFVLVEVRQEEVRARVFRHDGKLIDEFELALAPAEEPGSLSGELAHQRG